MNSRQLNFILRSLTVALYVGALAVVVIGVSSPLDREEVGAVASPGGGSTTRASDATNAPLTDRDLDRPLRPPLDASMATSRPTTETVTEEGSGGAAPLILLGTIGQSLAIVKTPDGTVATVGVDDRVGEIQITAIRASEIDVQIAGKAMTLHRAAEAGQVISETPIMTAK